EEEFAGRDVGEVVVVVAASVVPTRAAEHSMLRADILVDSNRICSVPRSFLQVGLAEVAGAVCGGEAGGGGLWPILIDQRPCDRIDQSRVDDVVGKRVLLKPPARNRPPCERIVDLILRAGL